MKDGRILTEVKTATGNYIATSGAATAASAGGTASGTVQNTTPSKYANTAVKE